jgi:adenosylcobinamide-GDP ribazoletransferase
VSDTLPSGNEKAARPRPFAELVVSLRFLTRLAIPFSRTIDPPALPQAMRLFGVAGAIIGAASGAVLLGLHALHLPNLMAGAFTCLFSALITGALHEDGLADSADGLFGGKTREQRLDIMRDSRIGSFGAIALGIAIMSRVGAYDVLIRLQPLDMIMIMAAVASFSRAMVVDMMWATRAARSDGLSVLAGRPGRNGALFALACGAALTLFAGYHLHNESGLVALVAAGLITGLMRRVTMRLIGGQTGDVCGAVQVLCEIVMLAVFAAMIG